MVFSYEERVIIKYLRIKYKYGAARTLKDYQEYEWNVNDVEKLLKKIDETGDVAQKEGFRRSKSLSTEENIKIVKGMFLNQEDQPGTYSTPTKIARELYMIVHQCPVKPWSSFPKETHSAKTY